MRKAAIACRPVAEIVSLDTNARVDGYPRVELSTRSGTKGEFRCLLCDDLLETFDGTTEVAIRLTVQPEKTFQGLDL